MIAEEKKKYENTEPFFEEEIRWTEYQIRSRKNKFDLAQYYYRENKKDSVNMVKTVESAQTQSSSNMYAFAACGIIAAGAYALYQRN